MKQKNNSLKEFDKMINSLRKFEFLSLIEYEDYDENSGTIILEILEGDSINPKHFQKIINKKCVKAIRFSKYGLYLDVEWKKSN